MLCPGCGHPLRRAQGAGLWMCNTDGCPVVAAEVHAPAEAPATTKRITDTDVTNKKGRGPGGTDRGQVFRPSNRTLE